ncbi:MAG: hypothetical protein CSA38_05060 [Flavobacteriales bacterium]|nr:MAG: hypothetical protein CSA38_05060 [Flavobacteriales bacterium]
MVYFVLLIILVFIGVPMLFFFLGKSLESKKTGIILAFVIFLLMILPIFYWFNLSLFFTKNDARELLARQKITLNDDFEFIEKEDNIYYTSFILKISQKDYQRLNRIFESRIDSVDILPIPKNSKSYWRNYNGDLRYETPMDSTGCYESLEVEKITIPKNENKIEYSIEWFY